MENDSLEDLEDYETNAELALYKEYRDVVHMFKFVVETERRFYLANTVDMQPKNLGSDVFFEVDLEDAWVWDVYRKSRFLKRAHIVSFKDVNIEEIDRNSDL
jgi:hypothetical protein